MIQNNLRTAQLAGFTCQLGCKKREEREGGREGGEREKDGGREGGERKRWRKGGRERGGRDQKMKQLEC